MSAEMDVAQQCHLASRVKRKRRVLHWATAECAPHLDELAARNMPATGLCGFTAVPTRPTNRPAHAVVCLACTLLKKGGAQ